MSKSRSWSIGVYWPVCLPPGALTCFHKTYRRLSPSGGSSSISSLSSASTHSHSWGSVFPNSLSVLPTQRRTWNWQIWCSRFSFRATTLYIARSSVTITLTPIRCTKGSSQRCIACGSCSSTYPTATGWPSPRSTATSTGRFSPHPNT